MANNPVNKSLIMGTFAQGLFEFNRNTNEVKRLKLGGDKNAKINWRFDSDDARIKLKRLYPTFDD